MYFRANEKRVWRMKMKRNLFFGEAKLTHYGLFWDSAILFPKQYSDIKKNNIIQSIFVIAYRNKIKTLVHNRTSQWTYVFWDS